MSESFQREADLDARIPHVFNAMTGHKWDDVHAGTRSIAATDLVRFLDVADQHDPARRRLAEAEGRLAMARTAREQYLAGNCTLEDVVSYLVSMDAVAADTDGV